MRQLVDFAPVADMTIQYASVSDLLKSFRQYLESEAGQPVQRIETNAAFFLYDLCEFLELGQAQRMKVLGKGTVVWIASELAERIKLPVIH
jgi:hypothetical protein